MPDLGRLIFFAGLAIAFVGGAIWLLGRLGFRGMPGDIAYEGEHVKFYFPIVTCIALSVLATLVMWLIRWLRGG